MKPRDAIDVVIEKLPPPSSMGKGKADSPAAPSYDEGGDSAGEAASLASFLDAIGVKGGDRPAALSALKDLIQQCTAPEETAEGE